ncbi:MAG: fumarylacetoacetate hydrolase family protein [Alkalibacterium sp.]|nr:fumarylacetoacetate hydrolase family protein [Alkalibacterium sp.]
MKLVRYFNDDRSMEKLGVQSEKGIIAISKLANHLNCNVPQTMDKLLENPTESLEHIESVFDRAKELHFTMEPYTLSVNSVTILPIVKQPEKILCVGLNYVDHVKATGGDVPTSPVFFSKFANTLAAHGQTVPIPPTSQKVDYEGELVIVIGKEMNGVSEKEARAGILGYSVGNDVSERQLQFQSSQWLIGKSFDFFAPTGPAIVTKDEIEDISKLKIRTRLNDNLVQDSSTSELIFSVEKIVSEASQYMTLKPGDLIFTGTPSGVILEQTEPVWLKPGDQVSITIDQIGTLTNTFL